MPACLFAYMDCCGDCGMHTTEEKLQADPGGWLARHQRWAAKTQLQTG